MSSDGKLTSIDTDAVSDAVDALEGENFDVVDVDSIERAGQGVEFDLSVRKLTRSAGFGSIGGDDGPVEVPREYLAIVLDLASQDLEDHEFGGYSEEAARDAVDAVGGALNGGRDE